MANVRKLTLTGHNDNDASTLQQGSVFFIGTATTLIRYGGFTLLTDPNFLHAGDHAHLGYGLTSKRKTNPAIEIEALPPLDLGVLSHMHGDHWDKVAEEKLPKTLPIATTPHAANVLRKQGFSHSQALNTWDSLTVTKGEIWLRITAMPGRPGPGMLNALLPPVMGSLLEWGVGTALPCFRLYISGDTLLYEDLKKFLNVIPISI